MTRSIKPYKPRRKKQRFQLDYIPVRIKPNWRLILGLGLILVLFVYSFIQIQEQKSAFRIADLQKQLREKQELYHQSTNRYHTLANYQRIHQIACNELGMEDAAGEREMLPASRDLEASNSQSEDHLYSQSR